MIKHGDAGSKLKFGPEFTDVTGVSKEPSTPKLCY